jgi:carbamoyltransferase
MPLTLSLHTGHDANMTIADPKTGEVVCFVEFEKVANRRYFKFKKDKGRFKAEFSLLAWPYIEKHAASINKINLCWVKAEQAEVVRALLPRAKVDTSKTHHLLHAYSVYAFSKPKKGDIIVSYDGGGDLEDYSWLYRYDGKEIKVVRQVAQNLGVPYRYLGLVAPEIKSAPTFAPESNQHLAGKVMGLAPRGKIVERFLNPLRDYYRFFDRPRNTQEIEDALLVLLRACGLRPLKSKAPKESLPDVALGRKDSENLLRSSQEVFEQEFFRHAKSDLISNSCQRVLLTGGCALNVKLNSLIFDLTGKDVLVLPVPGDCGISLGAAVKDAGLSRFKTFDDAFIGPEASGSLLKHIRTRDGKAVTADEVADLLASGKLIGTVIGKIEAGPRALGNRSLLANPCIKGMKDRLNRVKDREHFRPVAPLVTEEKQTTYFEECPTTKYMSFSPKIRVEHAQQLAEVVHYDQTCRIQTVTKREAFLHELLVQVGKRTGYEVLINTSFNTKGRPIINDIDEAFDLLDSSEIDYLYVDGFLFSRREGNAHGGRSYPAAV